MTCEINRFKVVSHDIIFGAVCPYCGFELRADIIVYWVICHR